MNWDADSKEKEVYREKRAKNNQYVSFLAEEG